MGFHRTTQPFLLDRAAVRCAVIEEIATLDTITQADPFHIDHDCLNPAGHDFRSACGDVVCVHCARIAWR
jgi:hypothetical protein